VSEAYRIVEAGDSECLSLRAKQSNSLKVQARIRRLSSETWDRSTPRNDMSIDVSTPRVTEGLPFPGLSSLPGYDRV
jgi:hypothetical protein